MDEDSYKEIYKQKGIRVLYRRLIIMGFSQEQASNMIAKFMGLGILENGWTVRELQHLLFLKTLNDKDNLEFIEHNHASP